MSKKAVTITDMVANVDPVEREFTHLSMGLALLAKLALKEKGMSQAEFAASLGKKESEVSRWFGGMHNLTLHSVAKLHVALGKKLVDLQIPALRPRSTDQPGINSLPAPTPVMQMHIVVDDNEILESQAA